jgi:hypothetical protein
MPLTCHDGRDHAAAVAEGPWKLHQSLPAGSAQNPFPKKPSTPLQPTILAWVTPADKAPGCDTACRALGDGWLVPVECRQRQGVPVCSADAYDWPDTMVWNGSG